MINYTHGHKSLGFIALWPKNYFFSNAIAINPGARITKTCFWWSSSHGVDMYTKSCCTCGTPYTHVSQTFKEWTSYRHILIILSSPSFRWSRTGFPHLSTIQLFPFLIRSLFLPRHQEGARRSIAPLKFDQGFLLFPLISS